MARLVTLELPLDFQIRSRILSDKLKYFTVGCEIKFDGDSEKKFK